MSDEARRAELSARVDAYAQRGNAVRKKEETDNWIVNPLYHYTDMTSLQGMLTNEKLWLTGLFHVNDPSEFRHGIKFAYDALALCTNENPPWSMAGRFCKSIFDVLTEDYSAMFGFFIGSFSRTENDLSQWRAYADNGKGVAVKIAPAWFHPLDVCGPKRLEDSYIVAPVVYDPDEAMDRQYEAIAKAARVVADAEDDLLVTAGPDEAHFFRELQLQLSVGLLWNALTTKHHAYENEQETRLILINDLAKLSPVLKTRTSGSDLIPYIPIDFPLRTSGTLLEIMVGPAAREQSEAAVQGLLRSVGVSPSGIVRKSDIPYRPR